MKSKDIIKRLQELDPSGELHVDCGEAILAIDRLPGYYDGPGYYMSESKYFPSDYYIDYSHDKICIQTISSDSFIWDKDGDLTKLHIIGASEDTEKRIRSDWEKVAGEYKTFHEKNLEHHLFDVMKMITSGYAIAQNADKEKKSRYMLWYIDLNKITYTQACTFLCSLKGDYYSHKFFKKKIIVQGCLGDREAIQESGFFKSIEQEGLIWWILKR